MWVKLFSLDTLDLFFFLDYEQRVSHWFTDLNLIDLDVINVLVHIVHAVRRRNSEVHQLGCGVEGLGAFIAHVLTFISDFFHVCFLLTFSEQMESHSWRF